MKKKLLSLFLTLCMIVALLPVQALAETPRSTSQIKLGDYVQMGGYNGTPILWRCVAFEKIKGYDANGNPITDSTDTKTEYEDGYLPLMLANTAILFRAFDAYGSNTKGSHARGGRTNGGASSGYWGDSNIRDLLNSSATAGNVVWSCGNSPSYDDEAGFLTNFTTAEKAAMKTVTQKSLLASCDAIDGIKIGGSATHSFNKDITDAVQNYADAYYENVTDTMFLLDVQQLYNVYVNGNVLGEDYYKPTKNDNCLRTPRADSNYSFSVRYVNTSGEVPGFGANNTYGIRPAFYLNQQAVVFKSGSGAKGDPYALHALYALDIPDQTYTGSAIEPTVTVKDGETTLVAGTDYTVEYEDNINVGTATATITGKGGYSSTLTKTFHIVKASSSVTAAPSAKTNLTYTGSAQELITAGTATGGEMQYSLTENGEYSITIPKGTGAGTYTVYYKVMGDANHNDTTPGSVKVTIGKATPTITVTAAQNLTYTGSAQSLVTAGTVTSGELQYSLDGTNYSTEIPTGTDAGDYTVYYKVMGDANHNDALPQSVTVTITKAQSSMTTAPTAKPNLTYTGTSQELVEAGNASGGTLQYSLSENNGYSTSIPTGTNAETYTVYYKVVGDSNHNDTAPGSVKVTIGKATPTVTGPTPNTLTYTGSAQALVTAGSSSGGTLQYSLSENDGYSTSIPTGTDAGDYTVYYKVVGGDNYSDVAAQSVTVNIAKADLTPTATAVDKIYDGSTSATGSITLAGAVNREQPAATGTFAFETAGVGTGKTVNVTGIALSDNWGDNYVLSTDTLTAEADITAKDIAGAIVTLDGSLTYTGAEQTQAVNKVEIGGLEATYTVSGNTGTDAKTYTLTVTGNGNFTGAQTKDFSIAQASNSITKFTCADIVHGEAPNPSATATFGTPAFTYSQTENGTFGAWSSENHVGIWYVKASVAATSNYAGIEKVIAFTESKEREATPQAVINYRAETFTGLVANAAYAITTGEGTAEDVTADASGVIALKEEWLGTTLSIVRKAENDDFSDSLPQSLSVKARPAAPSGKLTLTKSKDSIAVTNADPVCEYSIDGTNWQDTVAFTSLTAGREYTVQFRLKATATDFHSAAVSRNVTTVNADGSTALKPGETVETEDGATITNSGDTITAQKDDTTTTITLPSSGNIEVNGDGTVTVPGGSTVQNGDGPVITVGDQGGTVSGNGTVTIPGNGSVTIPDGNGGIITITVPESGGTVTTDENGDVVIPGDSTVQVGNNPPVNIPSTGGMVNSDGEIKYDVTVTFDTQGGSDVASQTIPVGSKATEPSDPILTGHSFDGWYTEADCTTAWDFDTVVTASMTLYAKWTKKPSPVTPGPDTPDEPTPSVWENPFADVQESDWYYAAVEFANENGLFYGTSDTTFSPNKDMSRGMLATVLYRLAKEPGTTAEDLFNDVANDKYYTEAIAWAAENDIVAGYGNGRYGPDDPITREQLATILWRYANSPESIGNLDRFIDGVKTSDWAIPALQWAVEQKIVSGKGNGVLDPTGKATRAEVAAMLMRYCENTK